ncbi:hypothetical protein YC2023_065091 [Brassica napus]
MSVTSTVEENHRKDPSPPEKAAEKRKRKWVFWERKWRRLDYFKLTASLFVHSMALLAPFYFSWSALWVTFLFYTIGGLGITVSYHRNLAHRSFKVPKWLEYLLAYCALLAIQGDPIDWVSTHRTWYHSLLSWWHVLRYLGNGGRSSTGGARYLSHKLALPYLGWLSVFSFGESWHNNHHAFESSARQGLEWWQIDISWYIVRFLEIIGLAYDVKLPTESQRRRMAIAH